LSTLSLEIFHFYIQIRLVYDFKVLVRPTEFAMRLCDPLK